MTDNRKVTRKQFLGGLLATASLATIEAFAAGAIGAGSPNVPLNETDPLAILRKPSTGNQTIFLGPPIGSALRIQSEIALEIVDGALSKGFRFFPTSPFMSVVLPGPTDGGDVFLADLTSPPQWGLEPTPPFLHMAVLSIGDVLATGLGRQEITIGRFDVDANNVGTDAMFFVTKTTGQVWNLIPTIKFGVAPVNSLSLAALNETWDLGTDGQVTSIDLGATPVTLVSSGGIGIVPPQLIARRASSGGVAKGWNRADHNHGLPAGTMVLLNADETLSQNTIPNTDTAFKTFTLSGGAVFQKAIVTEGEGYVQISNTTTIQDINIKIKYAGTQVGQTMKFNPEALSAAGKIPFSIKASALLASGAITITIGAAAADANTSVFLNSMRVYGSV